MKNRLMRALALAMLLALVVSAVPAMAAAKAKTRSIVAETLYAGTGDYWMTIKNWTWDETDVKITSSKPSVIRVPDKQFPCLEPKKAGKAKITVKFKVDGKQYKISKTLTVKKYPKAIQSLTINGQKVTLKDWARLNYWYEGDMDKPITVTINLKAAKGWKISKIKGYKVGMDAADGRKAITVKNNKKLTFGADYMGEVIYTLKNKKTGKTFKYTIYVDHVGE